MMKSAPTESKADRAARLAEEAKVEQERVRAEGNRIDDTQSILDADTLRRSRRFGQLSMGGLAGSSANAGSPGGDVNIAAMIARSLFTGGGVPNLRQAGGGSSGRSGGLAALV
jgi:hypothetical protein